MTYLVLFVLSLLAALGSLVGLRRFTAVLKYSAVGACLFVALVSAVSTSIVHIPANEVGIVSKVYGSSSLPSGRLIAMNGETGYQAGIIPPGAFLVSPFYNIINDVKEVPVVTVPQGFYGRIVAVDGESLPEGHVMADAWPEAQASQYLDAAYFLSHHGTKGLQASILRPGSYALNLAQFNVRIGYKPNGADVKSSNDDIYDQRGKTIEPTPLNTSITHIPAGFVGVVRSSITDVGKTDADCASIKANTVGEGLVTVLVPDGCKGIWNNSLPPGDYYLNRDAYDVTLVDTRVQTLEFKGGYVRRFIDLKVDQKGDFTQSERTVEIKFDSARSTDQAVFTKVEGWEVPQELRVVTQVPPKNAPIVVAAVGGLSEVESRIILPAIRSHVRNVFGGVIAIPQTNGTTENRPTQILDLVEQRPALEAEILARANEDGKRAGVDIKEIRLGDSVIPPELLLARQREQLAQQLKKAYEQEQAAQVQRQASEQARATADQQSELVKAQINVQTSELKEKQRAADGRAERAFLEQQAAGQTAQAEVLGKDSVMRLQVFKLAMDTLSQHPDILGSLRLPNTVVLGGSGLEGAVATLGGMLTPAEGSAIKLPTATPEATHR